MYNLSKVILYTVYSRCYINNMCALTNLCLIKILIKCINDVYTVANSHV